MLERVTSKIAGIAAALVLSGCYTTLDPTRLDEVPAACASAEWETSRYLVCPEALPHSAARDDCVERGAALVAFESAAENDWVAAAAFQWVKANVWLGGTRTEDAVWSWPHGSVFWRGGRTGSAEEGSFVRWQAGEPNDSSSETSAPERCLALTVEDYDWNDRSCELSLPYVCELPL